MSLDEIDAMSGVPASSARWFLEACLALGLAVADKAEPEGETAAHSGSPALSVRSSTRSAAAPNWLGHLRERLKLW